MLVSRNFPFPITAVKRLSQLFLCLFLSMDSPSIRIFLGICSEPVNPSGFCQWIDNLRPIYWLHQRSTASKLNRLAIQTTASNISKDIDLDFLRLLTFQVAKARAARCIFSLPVSHPNYQPCPKTTKQTHLIIWLLITWWISVLCGFCFTFCLEQRFQTCSRRCSGS